MNKTQKQEKAILDKLSKVLDDGFKPDPNLFDDIDYDNLEDDEE